MADEITEEELEKQRPKKLATFSGALAAKLQTQLYFNRKRRRKQREQAETEEV